MIPRDVHYMNEVVEPNRIPRPENSLAQGHFKMKRRIYRHMKCLTRAPRVGGALSLDVVPCIWRDRTVGQRPLIASFSDPEVAGNMIERHVVLMIV